MADKTRSTMTIEAPRSVIMAVIADFGAYPQWASGVRAAEILQTGPDGLPERVRFTIDAGVIKDSYVLSYLWQGDEQVRWELAERGSAVSEMSGAYRLDESDDGTRVTYELAVGLAIPMIGMLKRRAEKTIIDTALKGLRTRVQQTVGESGGGR
ncbi:MAG TPA: SRPBCC family protein [Streptosporangiaceae bacterium]|nr:SRPBCC family protein [Streptosporangiaceae bacterium]